MNVLLSCYTVEVRVQGLSRPTATGSDITSDKTHGADSNMTLIAEQIGRIPKMDKQAGLDGASSDVWRARKFK